MEQVSPSNKSQNNNTSLKSFEEQQIGEGHVESAQPAEPAPTSALEKIIPVED